MLGGVAAEDQEVLVVHAVPECVEGDEDSGVDLDAVVRLEPGVELARVGRVSWIVALRSTREVHGIRRDHSAPAALETEIREYIEFGNEAPRPLVWTKTADEIFEKLKTYCLRTSDSGH